MSLTTMPCEIIVNHIFPHFKPSQIFIFGCVDKTAQKILQYMAELPHPDVNYEGEDDTTTPWTTRGSLQQLFKMDVLNIFPEVQNYLKQPLATQKEAEFSFDSWSIFLDRNIKMALAPKNLKPLFVLFDFSEGKMDMKGLQIAAFHAITCNHSPLVLQGIILGHPNAENISGEGEGSSFYSLVEHSFESPEGSSTGVPELHSKASPNPGLGFLLECSLNTYERSDEEKLKLLRIIAAHPNAKNIPVCHLQAVMTYAVRGGRSENDTTWEGGNPEIVKAIFTTFPNATKIPARGKDSIESALEDADAIGDPEMIQVLQEHPNAGVLNQETDESEEITNVKKSRKRRDKCTVS